MVGLLSRLRQPSANVLSAAQSSPDAPLIPGTISGNGTILYTYPAISRERALAVPEIKRARDLIAGTIANAKLYEELRDGSRSTNRTFLKQPDPQLLTSTMVAATVSDLFFDGVSVWYITSRYSGTGNSRIDGFPATAFHVPWNACQIAYDTFNHVTKVLVNGVEVKPEDCLIFRHSSDGILTTGASTIQTGLYIEQAVKSAMKRPMPNVKVKNNGPDLPEEDIAKFMGYYEEVVQNSTALYESRNVDVQPLGWNPEQLALASLRKQQATAFSRLTGVPAWYLSAESGDSLTYSTNLQARQDLYSLTLMPYITTIEQTLTTYATPRGSEVKFDFFDFLQADPSIRADLYSKLIPLGVMTVDEARMREGFIEETQL